MTYALFLDDERHPPEAPVRNWVIVRSFDEAVEVMTLMGFPDHCSFDHDLGPGKTGLDVAHWMIAQHLDGALLFPEDFSFVIHSMNSVGGPNIKGLMDSFKKFII